MDKKGRWVTYQGRKIFIEDGDTAESVYAKQSKKLADEESDRQERQIAERQREQEELNAENPATKKPRMSGYDPKYGAYKTKEDTKLDIIDKMRSISLDLPDSDSPEMFSHAAQARFKEYARLERRLAHEYGMSEEEIFQIVHQKSDLAMGKTK